MQFKHPEILYALLLLVIPIIIHLFQLRRFKKVPFTNIKFLKEVELQTRKSSRLKKLLVLLTRLLLFTALIIAFAQPYLSNIKDSKPTDTYIYLDNSFSMQAKGTDGELLKRAVQDIISGTSSLDNIHLFTNNEVYKNLSGKDIKNTLLSIDYHPVRMDMNAILLKIKSDIHNKNALNNIFLISDFLLINSKEKISIDSIHNYYITKLLATNKNNISIDSVYIINQDNESIDIKAIIKNYGLTENNLSISLFNEHILAGKSTISFTKNLIAEADFSIPNTNTFNGKLKIDDGYLDFDNELFFTINKAKKINITAIGENNRFLSKIYTNDEFNFISTSINKFDYNTIEEQHLLILTELESIPITLTNILKEFVDKGGSLVMIPPVDLDLNTYSSTLRTLNLGNLSNSVKTELAVSTINFSHPLLKGVFEKKVKNFQYPTVKSYYDGNFRNASSILKFENSKNFISQIPVNKGVVYWFSASIDTKNSNFKSSPLIVPIFYNFGLYSSKPSQLYYTIGKTNSIEINAQLSKDDVLHLTTAEEDFIPQQQITAKKVTVITASNPIKSGFINVQHKQETIKNLAYNYGRTESDLSHIAIKEHFREASNITHINSITEAFTIVLEKYKTTNLWQLFLGLALLFLVTEIILLKFLKP
jgi:hypothetical protein